jgi:hypothetical protein
MSINKEIASNREREAGFGEAGDYFGFATMLAELTDYVERFCRRLRVEEGAGRLIRGHLTNSLASVNDRLTDAIQMEPADSTQKEFDEAGRHINSLIFWLSQMEFMSSQAREAAVTCRIRCENLGAEINQLANRMGVKAGESEGIGAERRRDFHLRQLIEKADYENALLYIDAIVQLGEANENPLLAGKYRSYRDRVLQIKDTVN